MALPDRKIDDHKSDYICLIGSEDEKTDDLISSLGQAKYQVSELFDIDDLEKVCKQQTPISIILDTSILQDSKQVAKTLDRLSVNLKNCPPVIILSENDDIEIRLEAMRSGAHLYFNKPPDVSKLIDALDDISNKKVENEYKVLLIEDGKPLLDDYLKVFHDSSFIIETLSGPEQCLTIIKGFQPDVIIVDLNDSNCTGPELVQVIRQSEVWHQTPIILLINEVEISQKNTYFDHPAINILFNPVSPGNLMSIVATKAGQARRIVRLNKDLAGALRESEFKSFTMDQHDIVSITDSSGRIVDINDKFCEISGYSQDELLGKNHRILKSGYHDDSFYEDMWDSIYHGKVWHGTICNRKKDGSFYWVESTIVPFLDSNGLPYKYVSARTDITRVKVIEEAIKESESRLNYLVTSSPVTIYTREVEPPYGVTYVSENVKHYMGYTQTQFTKDSLFWEKHVHPDDRLKYFEEMPKLSGNGKVSHEYRYRMADGNYCWIYDEMRLVEDDDGNPLEIVGYWADISKRKEMETDLDQSKERLRRGQIYANIGTWDWNIETGGLIWSERIAPLFGYPEGELETSYANFMVSIHPDDRDMVANAVKASIEKNIPYEVEHRVVWPDGTVRWLMERGRVLHNKDGKAVRMLGVVQDIDVRKRAELELAENQSKLSGLFDLSPLGIALTDMNGNYLEFNTAFRDICGYSEEELKSISYWELTPEKYKGQEAEQIESLYKSGFYGPYEKVYIRKDGTRIPVRLNGMLFIDKAGKERIWSIVEDITDRKKAEQALIDARLEAEDANRAKSQFLSSMSHELRTPMNAIMGFGQLLEMDIDAPLNESQQENVDEIIKASNHLLELINEVLDLSRIESGRIDLSLEKVVLDEVMAESLQLINPLAMKRGIEITLMQENKVVTLRKMSLTHKLVRADRTRLKQVLLNLLSNAVKYNRENGKIIISCHDTDSGNVRVNISDTGPGLTNDQQEHLFEAFNRLGAAQAGIEGTGIGLVITRNIIELMGGSIGVETQPEKGSTFWFELPGEASDMADTSGNIDNIPEYRQDLIGPEYEYTVLYIEDNPVNLKLVSQLLGYRPNIHLWSAHEPKLGLELAWEYNPDLILLDINLPGMDGHEVLRRLRTNDTTRNTPIIAVSANAMPRDIEKGLEEGFDEYITKPIDAKVFLQTVEDKLKDIRT